MLNDKETGKLIIFFLFGWSHQNGHCHLSFKKFMLPLFYFLLLLFILVMMLLVRTRWLTDAVCTAWDAGKCCPASSTRESPLTAAHLPLGRSKASPAFIGRGNLIFLPLLLAGFSSVKSLIPMLIHLDPPPLWKTKPIPFHLPSPTADSRPLLTQIWVWHPRLVRHIHPVMFYFFLMSPGLSFFHAPSSAVKLSNSCQYCENIAIAPIVIFCLCWAGKYFHDWYFLWWISLTPWPFSVSLSASVGLLLNSLVGKPVVSFCDSFSPSLC